MKNFKRQKNGYFDIKMKLYTLLTLLGYIIYTIGIWIWTPSTNPPLLKDLALGLMLLVLVILSAYYLFKKTNEKPDERFFRNLAKSTSVMFGICILILIALAYFLFSYGNGVLHPAIFFIIVGVMIVVFGMVFLFFENKG